MTAPECRYDTENGWQTPEDRPCDQTHCALTRGCSSHVDTDAGIYTCPKCIGKVRRNLRDIENLYALTDVAVDSRGYSGSLLLDEVESGVETEAFNLVGPAAAPEQYAEHRRRLGQQYTGQGWCDWPRAERYHEDDPHHPYAVLGRWDLDLRERYGPQTDLFVTVSSAVAYLTSQLAGPFPHTQPFEDFAREIATCLNHLESVIHDSRVPEQGRHCPACVEANGSGPRLRKHYASHPGHEPGQTCQQRAAGKPCATCSGRLDTWHCPNVGDHWWSEPDYRARVATDYREHAPALTVADLADRCGVPAGTIRRWAASTRRFVDGHHIDVPPRIRPVGRSEDGRKLYRVADVMREAAARRVP